MYHGNRPDVIEGNDMVALRSSRVERRSDGRVLAHLVVELRPDKTYRDAPQLHVTDGVTHTMHRVEPLEEPEAAIVPLSGDDSAPSLAETLLRPLEQAAEIDSAPQADGESGADAPTTEHAARASRPSSRARSRAQA